MRVLQLSHAFNHLIISALHRSLADDGQLGLLAVGGNAELLHAAMPGAVAEVPQLLDVSKRGQYLSQAPLAQVVSSWRPDAVVYHEPPLEDSTLLRYLIDRMPVAAFLHNIICPGGKLLRRRDQLCGQRMGWSCLRTWYTGPCGSHKSPAVALREVRASLRRAEVLKQLSLVLVASEHMRRHLLFEGFADERVRVIDPGYRWDAALPPAAQPADDRRRLLFVGRLAYNKGVQNLLRAVARAGADSFEVVIVGDGYYRTALERLAGELRLAHVRFVGWLDQPAIAEYYRWADLLVMPSLWPEPYGAVVAEAAQHGLPALVSDRGALPEWRDRLSNVTVVNVSDPAAFAEALRSPRLETQPTPLLESPSTTAAPSLVEVLAEVFGRRAFLAGPERGGL